VLSTHKRMGSVLVGMGILDLDQLRRSRARLPVLRDERTALVQRELTRILNAGRA